MTDAPATDTAPAETGPPWAAPLFLLSPPRDPAIPWRFVPPTLEAPVSQLPTIGQCDSPTYERLRAMLRIRNVPHRRNWEQVWLLAMAEAAGMLAPGIRALGFGCGMEAMPSVLAQLGLEVLATDMPGDLPAAAHWIKSNQHGTSAAQLHRPAIVPEEDFTARVSFRPVDMNAIPKDLKGFDLCWSGVVLPHLGSIDAAVDAAEASLAVLRPGGVALHTAMLLLDSPDDKVTYHQTTYLRRRDIEHLLSRLVSAGHEVWPLNLHPGDQEGDAHLDGPPHGMPHLKILQGGRQATSIGIAVRKAG